MTLTEEYNWYLANEIDLNEASLSRFNTHYTKGNIIAFISGYRHTNTLQQNKANNKVVEVILRSAGFGYNKVTGHYVEDMNVENPVDSAEASFGVYCSPEKADALFELIKGIARKFDQECFLWVGKTEEGQSPA